MAPSTRVQDADVNALVTAGIRDRTPTGVTEVTNAWGKFWAPSTWRRQAWTNPRVGLFATITFFPRLTTVVPAPLVAIVGLTAVTAAFAIAVPSVGDEGKLPKGLPSLLWPGVPMMMETLRIVAPFRRPRHTR